jgi:hypothetical protein
VLGLPSALYIHHVVLETRGSTDTIILVTDRSCGLTAIHFCSISAIISQFV